MEKLIKFLDNSYTCFHAISNLEKELINAGFIKLDESKKWNIEPEKNYYIIRNTSSIIAIKIPSNIKDVGFNIVASHSDSPCYKLKPNATINDVRNNYTKLNTEGYGGMIATTWLDRPLGIAGRVFVEKNDEIKEELITLEETLVIPNVAIHLSKDQTLNPQIDMLPLLGEANNSFESVLSKYVDGKVLSNDLFLYNKEKAMLSGLNNEYFMSGRLDDLECAYTSVEALIKSNPSNIAVCAVFNNEEVGSTSANGADSQFLVDTLNRIADALSFDIYQALASSFIISADNAHAVHPNHPEKSDSTNMVYMNKGVVVKHQASLRYTTDALSEAIFKKICNLIDVPYQDYTNRSDMRGGSTLGAISQSHLSIPSVDIGLAQLAMHSIYETCGVKDIEYMVKVLNKFYDIKLKKNNNKIEIL